MAADVAQLMSMPNPPAYVRADAEAGPAWPVFGRVSSGCLLLIECFDDGAIRPGYAVVHIYNRGKTPLGGIGNFAGAMEDVRRGFGRTFSRLPAVFGVSRQTLYNWLGGETPNERHQARILELAEAARAFAQVSYAPTSASLSRTLSRGKSFLELVSEGASGRDAARKLIALTQRSTASRARLDAVLDEAAPPPVSATGFGLPALDEDAS